MPTRAQIIDLYHIARTALAGEARGRWERMNYVRKHLAPLFPEVSAKKLWLAIDEATQ